LKKHDLILHNTDSPSCQEKNITGQSHLSQDGPYLGESKSFDNSIMNFFRISF